MLYKYMKTCNTRICNIICNDICNDVCNNST